MTYHSLWQSLLPCYDAREAQAIVRMVLDEKYGLSLTDIVCGGVEKIDGKRLEGLQAIMRRLQAGEPVQYVLGYADFYGRRFHVEPGVLIPRPETEQLCSIIIDDMKSLKLNADAHDTVTAGTQSVLDIGTGSGCIAITLAGEIQGSKVYAIDISDDALRIARGNADRLDAAASFIKQDVLDEEGMGKLVEGNIIPGQFSVIVSNPPYIALKERGGMSRNVLEHEPRQALFVPDDDPLLFYHAIAKFAAGNLSPWGRLYFEINPIYAKQLEAMLRSFGFANVVIMEDGFGKQRFACAWNFNLKK